MPEANGRTILIVDDEPDILLVLSQFLKSEGFGVLAAPDGRQAIKLASENSIDLALIDIAMPMFTGIDTLREMKGAGTAVPTVMITAFRDAEKVVEAFRLGALDCVFKPFNLKELKDTISAQMLDNPGPKN